MEKNTDAERLDWLESYARRRDGILLHAETKPTGRLGLGLAQPDRSLRKAIDDAMRYDRAESKAPGVPHE